MAVSTISSTAGWVEQIVQTAADLPPLLPDDVDTNSLGVDVPNRVMPAQEILQLLRQVDWKQLERQAEAVHRAQQAAHAMANEPAVVLPGIVVGL